MFETIFDYAGNVCEQLNKLEENGQKVEVISSKFEDAKYLRVFIKVTKPAAAAKVAPKPAPAKKS